MPLLFYDKLLKSKYFEGDKMRYTDFLIPAVEAAGYSRKNKYPVFIILTSGDSKVSSIIRKGSGSRYSHASIAFNEELNPIYSFGRNDEEKFSSTGFIQTNPYSSLWSTKQASEIPYAIYVTFVDKNSYDKMQNRLKDFTQNPNKFKYNWIGLLRIFFGLPSKHAEKWFCSAFVAEILGNSKMLGKDSTLFKPEELSNIDDVVFVTSGFDIHSYDSEETKRILKEIKKI